MATLEQLSVALRNADAAGDEPAARALAAEIMKMRGQSQQPKGAGMAHTASGSFLEGIPVVGPYIRAGAERVGAGVDTLLDGKPYSQNLERRQQTFKDSVAENPKTAIAGNVAGGVVGTMPLVAAVPAAFGAGAGGLAVRSGASAVTGGALGGADAAVRSGFDPKSTAIGAGLGLGLGAFGPAVAAGVGKGVTWAADRALGLSKPTGPVAGINRKAVDYAVDAFGSPANRAQMQSELQRLGPQAMLADVSPDWQGVARGAASRPGQRDAVVNALLSRDAGKNARLGADLDASLGRPVVPSQIDDALRQSQQVITPEYGRVLQGARAVDTESLAHALETQAINLRGPAQKAAREVRAMLNVVGTDQLDPNPATLLQTRQAIDGLMTSNADPNVVRVLASARQQVDDALARSVPGIKDVDAKFAELARQREGLTRGQQVLGTGPTSPRPAEIAQEIQSGALPQGQQIGPSAVPVRMRQGARAEIDRVVGTNANDPAAMQRLLRSEGDWNRDKLRTIFGQPQADRALNAVDRETTFYRTANRVTGGSDTAMANRFGDFLDDAARPNAVPTDTTVFGAALRGSQKVLQSLMRSNSEKTAEKFAEALGRVSVATGSERDAIIDALLDVAARKQSLQPINDRVAQVARALLASSPPAANQQLIAR